MYSLIDWDVRGIFCGNSNRNTDVTLIPSKPGPEPGKAPAYGFPGLLAWLEVSQSQSPPKPGQSRGFGAKPGLWGQAGPCKPLYATLYTSTSNGFAWFLRVVTIASAFNVTGMMEGSLNVIQTFHMSGSHLTLTAIEIAQIDVQQLGGGAVFT